MMAGVVMVDTIVAVMVVIQIRTTSPAVIVSVSIVITIATSVEMVVVEGLGNLVDVYPCEEATTEGHW